WRRRSESPRHHDSPSSLTGRKDRQTVSLSATIACPRDLWAFFRPHVSESYLAIVAEGGERPIDAAVRIEPTLIGRFGRREHCNVLAFVNSRRVADRLVEDMKRSTGFKDGVFIHHSSISRDYRVRN